MVGVRAWKPGDAGDSIFEIIHGRFEDHLLHGGWNYQSIDMKVDIDVEMMEKFAEELEGLIELDPRGGHFLQRDFETGVKRAAVASKCRELFQAFYQTKGYDNFDHAVTWVAYQYRVMLSHFREKYTGYLKIDAVSRETAPTHPEWLKKIYKKLKDVEVESMPQAAAYPRRQHPLPAFRAPEDDERQSAMLNCVFNCLARLH